ncbi:NADH-quinone oxidoreductase subunit NuoH [Oscillochloris sp. ZM17-4]|uniref:NADH-quinone oxidoreductase subunit NuoH n=1 Tax=Oscillochloris sp. ZM17-4 TaxID=2866714 RepID=UPI001C72AEB7|nr:NADH-quinone oxidoreductase subunit NuoH [Oscillochloris sp. ZM17-4]MBX0327535.1 NADH-quinone oxidoreductase subunit NuoH [Oscillochloris sp. ZM17-4]
MRDVIEQIINTTFGWGWPGWAISLIGYLIVAAILFLIAPFQMLFLTLFERRAIARMQDRVGPNRVGPEGAWQPLADGVKIFTKEDIVPDSADRWVHLIAPCVVVAPTMFMFAVVPWGPGMVPVDMNIGLLFFFAISSVSAVGLMMAGWASNNKFALIGAMRAVAQMVSYEIPAVLSLLSIVLITGSLSLVDLIAYQGGLFISSSDVAGVPDLGLGWFIFTPVGFLAFIAFFIAALAEGERTPFDIPEADSEIVAGYMTEYSGMKFGLFYLAQYVLNFLLCAITSVIFFGGWQGPGVGWLYAQAITPANPGGGWIFNVLAGALGVFYFLAKTYGFFFVMVWIRGAYPRLRIDQLMDFGWKFLIPLTLVNIFGATIWVALTKWGAAEGLAIVEGWSPMLRWAVAFVVTLALNLGAYLFLARIFAESQAERLRVDDEVLERLTNVA